MKLEDYLTGSGPVKYVEDRIFSGETLSDISLAPAIGESFVLQNVSFRDCKVLNRMCFIHTGTILKNVSIDNIRTCRELHIAADVPLIDVSISSKRSTSVLWIKPPVHSEGQLNRQCRHSSYNLDISNYFGEVIIYGIDLKQISINENLHVKLHSKNFDNFDWTRIKTSNYSYWQSVIDDMAYLRCDQAVVSVPRKTLPDHESSMRELNQLIKLGLTGTSETNQLES